MLSVHSCTSWLVQTDLWNARLHQKRHGRNAVQRGDGFPVLLIEHQNLVISNLLDGVELIDALDQFPVVCPVRRARRKADGILLGQSLIAIAVLLDNDMNDRNRRS